MSDWVDEIPIAMAATTTFLSDGRVAELLNKSVKFHTLASAVDQQMLGSLCWDTAREEPERFDEMNRQASLHYYLARRLMRLDD